MENATKALLIAAAILIAIVLISLGVFVLGRGQEAVQRADLSETQIMQFNSKWTGYEGKKSGSVVNSMLQQVITNNQLAQNESAGDGSNYSIEVDGDAGIKIEQNSVPTTTPKVNTGKYYNVTLTYTNGMISKITINK